MHYVVSVENYVDLNASCYTSIILNKT